MRLSTPTTAVAALAALILAGCGQGGGADGTSHAPGDTHNPSHQSANSDTHGTAADLTLQDGWVKSVEELDAHAMTAAFGVLHNHSDHPIRLIGGSSPAAGKVELHNTVMTDGTMSMQEAPDGFTIPAGGTFVLEPGGDHVMLMELLASIPAGTDVDVTVVSDDGTPFTMTVPARAFAGAEETYAPGHDDATKETDSP